MRIIIVDDDCLVAGALKTILEVNEDVEVLDIGSDGKQACQLYEKYEPDVLLMDIRMRKMDGLEASEHILENFAEKSEEEQKEAIRKFAGYAAEHVSTSGNMRGSKEYRTLLVEVLTRRAWETVGGMKDEY